jgi:hypothetical protein
MTRITAALNKRHTERARRRLVRRRGYAILRNFRVPALDLAVRIAAADRVEEAEISPFAARMERRMKWIGAFTVRGNKAGQAQLSARAQLHPRVRPYRVLNPGLAEHIVTDDWSGEQQIVHSTLHALNSRGRRTKSRGNVQLPAHDTGVQSPMVHDKEIYSRLDFSTGNTVRQDRRYGEAVGDTRQFIDGVLYSSLEEYHQTRERAIRERMENAAAQSQEKRRQAKEDRLNAIRQESQRQLVGEESSEEEQLRLAKLARRRARLYGTPKT